MHKAMAITLICRLSIEKGIDDIYLYDLFGSIWRKIVLWNIRFLQLSRKTEPRRAKPRALVVRSCDENCLDAGKQSHTGQGLECLSCVRASKKG